MAVLPADITVTPGMELPDIANELAEKVREPEGFVSEEAYENCTPAGNPVTATRAVSLVELIWMGMLTGFEPTVSWTLEMGR